MGELKYSRQRLFAFRNFLALNHVFIDKLEVLDKILSCAHIIFDENKMDFSSEKEVDKELEDLYNTIYNDAKEWYINYLKKENETLSELRESEV